MILTCIINQFDCNAGTKADACCISFGKLNVANVYVSNVVGAVIAARKGNKVNVVQSRWILVKAHERKINDSYKLLSGKWPECAQRKISNNASDAFESNIPNVLIFVNARSPGKKGCIHDQSIKLNKTTKEKFPTKISFITRLESKEYKRRYMYYYIKRISDFFILDINSA